MKKKICLGSGEGPCPLRVELAPGTRLRCHHCAELKRKENALVYYHQRGGHARRERVGFKKEKMKTFQPIVTRTLERFMASSPPDTSRWACRKCGCTERVACYGGCAWVGPSLCDRCATAEQLYVYSIAQKMGPAFVAQLLNGLFKLPKEYGLKVKGVADVQEKKAYQEEVRAAKGFRSTEKYRKGSHKSSRPAWGD